MVLLSLRSKNGRLLSMSSMVDGFFATSYFLLYIYMNDGRRVNWVHGKIARYFDLEVRNLDCVCMQETEDIMVDSYGALRGIMHMHICNESTF